MSTPSMCKRSEVEHVRKFLAYAKRLVNETRYYPPSYGYRYMVALALYSKSITVAEATLVLYTLRSNLVHAQGFLVDLASVLPPDEHVPLYVKLESLLRKTL